MTARTTLGESAGVQVAIFRCPGCDDNHQIRVDRNTGWGFNGDVEHPTFTPSVLVRGVQWDEDSGFRKSTHAVAAGEQTICHSFVTGGRIQFLDDCTHALAGQTVDLPEWSS